MPLFKRTALPVALALPFAAVAMFFAFGAQAQSPTPSPAPSPNQNAGQNAGQSSSSSGSGADSSSGSNQSPTLQPLSSENGGYLAIDPLAGVRYDNRWDLSVGMASAHTHAGPNLREGADLGGLDVSASYWLTKHWGLAASGRGYLGTSGAAPNDLNLDGLFIAQYMGLVGPEFLGPRNKHAAFIIYALAGGAYGDFNTDLRGATPGPGGPAGFYNNQLTLGGAVGAHVDLNRSPRWVFRVSPEALLTTYNGTSAYPRTQWNFGISVGMEYKFKKTRFKKPTKSIGKKTK